MRYPLIALTIAFCAGIFLARQTRIPFLWLYLFAAALLILNLIVKKKAFACEALILLLVFLLGALLYQNQKTLSPDHVGKFVGYKSRDSFLIKGYICEEPQVEGPQKVKFIFKVQEIQFGKVNYRCRGYILVYSKYSQNLNYGQELILRGRLTRPLRWDCSRRISYRDYLYSRGIYLVMYIKSSGDIIKLNKNSGYIFKKIALRVKNRMEVLVQNHVTSLASSIMNAMILGDKKNIPDFIYDSMVNTGTVHILVVSGFNVGLVACIFSLFLKLIRIKKRMRFYLVTSVLVMYCLIVGASTPVLRATLMAIAFLFAFLVQREPDTRNICALSALIIIASSPNQLFDIGFQLSFASVISIVFLYPKIKSILRSDNLRPRPLKFIIDSLLVSFSAWIGTAGFIAYYFKTFSLVTVLANLIVVPLASLITIAGFVLVVAALIYSPLAYPFAYTCELAIIIMLKINLFLANLAFSHFSLP